MADTHTYHIFAVSDATGEMAMNIAFAGLRQFKIENVNIVRKARVTDRQKMAAVITEAKKRHAVILFTFVGHHLRDQFIEECAQQRVVAIDIMGPVMEVLTNYLHSHPSDEPGLKYKQTSEYFRRQEAIDFTVKHDDGMGLDTLGQADIVLLGISRTSKTPLSVYLAFRGHKVANLPLIREVPIPQELDHVEKTKLVGLTISAEKLVQFRETRLIKLGRPLSEEYASIDRINEELNYARGVFEQLGNIPVIDVTGKAIEEIATEVLLALGK
jgi:[pyruvate, water dikinase]-phosphate phosphotransferase / [pyruvate, water dikinase] kinase